MPRRGAVAARWRALWAHSGGVPDGRATAAFLGLFLFRSMHCGACAACRRCRARRARRWTGAGRGSMGCSAATGVEFGRQQTRLIGKPQVQHAALLGAGEQASADSRSPRVAACRAASSACTAALGSLARPRSAVETGARRPGRSGWSGCRRWCGGRRSRRARTRAAPRGVAVRAWSCASSRTGRSRRRPSRPRSCPRGLAPDGRWPGLVATEGGGQARIGFGAVADVAAPVLLRLCRGAFQAARAATPLPRAPGNAPGEVFPAAASVVRGRLSSTAWGSGHVAEGSAIGHGALQLAVAQRGHPDLADFRQAALRRPLVELQVGARRYMRQASWRRSSTAPA